MEIEKEELERKSQVVQLNTFIIFMVNIFNMFKELQAYMYSRMQLLDWTGNGSEK